MTRPRSRAVRSRSSSSSSSRPTGIRFSADDLDTIRRACLVIEGRQNYPARFSTFVRFAAVTRARAIIAGEQSETEAAAEGLRELDGKPLAPPAVDREIPVEPSGGES